MNSILKIIVDLQCQVYCDFELVGEACPNSMFKMEMRKGTYILDFKIDKTTIISQECTISSTDEELLLRINLSEAVSKKEIEHKCLEIANINAEIEYKNGDEWIVDNDSGQEIRLMYNLEDRQYSNRNPYFDEVGLLT